MRIKKSANGDNYPKVIRSTFFIEGILFSILVFYITRFFPFSNRDTFWITAYLLLFTLTIIIYRHYRSLGLVMDIIVIVAFIWWIYTGVGYKTRSYVFFPLMIALWLSISHKLKWKYSVLLAWSVPLFWFVFSHESALLPSRTTHYFVLISSFLMLFVYTLMIYIQPRSHLKKIDFILCSYSGNTAHFASLFMDGAKETGTDIVVHRFHHYKSFKSSLHGDSLVIAFPVFGCKPPWPFLNYLVFKLPSGRGKPAFILYTCIGGAENAGILCWLILTLKGYRVIGRNMAVYPLNVPTFRLGPRNIWKYLDTVFPRQGDITYQLDCGREFAKGQISGIPFIFALTPAFIVGILIDNKLFDTFLYRNHVIKKRCNQCGICIDFCPVERLKMVNDYPKAKGTCMICLGCINNCPKKAMHFWFLTEYGIQYKLKHKQCIVKIEQLTKKST